MRDKIKQAFDSVQADAGLRARTMAYVSRRTGGCARRPGARAARVLAAAACLTLAFVGGGWLYFTPTAAISVDINPSIELAVNRFDRVLSVTGWGEDGKALAGELDVRFADYTEALDRVLENQTVAGLLGDDALLTVTVVGPDNAQCGRMLSGVQACTAGGAQCYAARPEEVEAAHEAGLSYGKYRAFLEAQALDPSLTPDDVRGLTMRQLRELIAALSGQADGAAGSHETHGAGGAGGSGPQDGSGRQYGRQTGRGQGAGRSQT